MKNLFMNPTQHEVVIMAGDVATYEDMSAVVSVSASFNEGRTATEGVFTSVELLKISKWFLELSKHVDEQDKRTKLKNKNKGA